MFATRLEVLFDIVLYLLMCVVFLRALSKSVTSQFLNTIGSILILLFFLFAFWGGDYFHYQEGFDIVKQNPDVEMSLEDVYYWIISVSPSYLFFRLIVWGGCFAIYMIILSRLRIPLGIGLLSFVAFSLLRLSYARASLAMAIMYLGLAVYTEKRNSNKFLPSIIGLGLVFVSFFFHKSAYFGIVMIISSILLSYINKKGVGVAFMVIIILSSFILVRSYIGDLMLASIDPEETNLSLEVGQKYIGRDKSDHGWGGQIRNIAEMVPYYWGLWIYIRLRLKGKLKKCSITMKSFANLFLVTVLVASAFSFDYGRFNTIFLYHRFMRFNLIPLAIFMSFCYINGYEKKLVKQNFYIGILVVLLTLTYSFLHA